MKRLVNILVVWLAAMSALAVVATPEPVLRTLPDGRTEMVYLHGDENRSYLTRLDGTMVEGSLIEAVPASSATNIRRGASATMLGGYVPTSGVVRIPVILVAFSDLPFSLENAKEKFDDLYNGNGGSNPRATGSVSSYFSASSNGALILQYDVYGPYTLSRKRSYYGENSGSSHNKNARELVVESAQLADAAGVNFAQYDNNGDGNVDNISIIVAGYNEAEGGDEACIWPHYSSLSGSDVVDGKGLKGYLMTSEYRSSGGSIQCGIGTYCHEFGHALGLPDLYDTENSKRYTVGSWDIMSNGSYNNNGCTPPTFTAFERFMMGWLTPIQLEQPNNYVLLPIETSNTAYVIADGVFNGSNMNPSPNEYFFLENRQKVGWDAGTDALVGTGLMISHVTFSSNGWKGNTFNNNDILGFDIIEAAIEEATSSTASDLFPGTMKVTSWVPKLNVGRELDDQVVLNITEQSSGAVSFHYGVNANEGFFFSPKSIDMLTTTIDNGLVQKYDTAYLEITVKNVDSDSLLITTSSEYFEISTDGGETWVTRGDKYYAAVQKNSTYVIPIWIRFVPRRQNCSSRSTFVTVQTTDGKYVNQLQLTGWAPRPTYIVTPIILGVQDVSSSTFTLIWEPQDDAESYYITAYSVKETPSTDTETFDDFSSLAAIEEAGWSANFADQVQNISKSGKAMYFTQSNQTLTTKTYLSVPSEVSFWLSNNYVTSAEDSVTGGRLLFEASKGDGEWKVLDNMRVVRTTKNLEKNYTLQQADGYVQFRLTYTHLGGTGGLSLDDFTAYMDREIHFLYQGTEREMLAPTSRLIFTGLEANETYYCAVQAYENKGCEEHLTPLSAFWAVTTLAEPSDDVRLEVVRGEDGLYTAKLPQSSDGTSVLYVFGYDGRVLDQVKIPYGATSIEIPTSHLTQYNYYVLKVVDGRMKRKGAKGKMLYY